MNFMVPSDVVDHFKHPMAGPLLAYAENKSGSPFGTSFKVLVTQATERVIIVSFVRDEELQTHTLIWDGSVSAYVNGNIVDKSIRIPISGVHQPHSRTDHDMIYEYQEAKRRPLDLGDMVVPKNMLTTGDRRHGRIVARVEYVKVNWNDGTSSEVSLDTLMAK